MRRIKSPINAELNVEVPLSGNLNVSLNVMTQYRMEIMQQLDDGQPYERDRIVHEARSYMAQSTEAMLKAGKRLTTFKESEPHEDFVGTVEERPGLHVCAAQRMMRTSSRYPSLKLESKATTLPLPGKIKLLELVARDDDDLAKLADDGTVAGLALDDADRMSVRKSRQTLRETCETNAAQQYVSADRSEKIDSLSTRLEKKSRIQPSGPDEEVKKLWVEVVVLAVEAEPAIIVRLFSAFEMLCAYRAENMIDAPGDFMTGLVCQLRSTARSLCFIFDSPGKLTNNTASS